MFIIEKFSDKYSIVYDIDDFNFGSALSIIFGCAIVCLIFFGILYLLGAICIGLESLFG